MMMTMTKMKELSLIHICLINFTADLNSAMKDHLESATVFKGRPTKKIIQNDILDCMLSVCREEIEKEIQASEFVTIECEQTTDVIDHCQMVLVFRYVFKEFWGFLSPEVKCAETVAMCITNNINPLQHTSKKC